MIIYKMENILNGKIYIGQTTRTLEERMNEHMRHHNTAIDKAIDKYGMGSFDIEIVDRAETTDELNEKEIYWIAKLEADTEKGYNLCKGGNNTFGYKHSEETKRKISEKRKGLYTGDKNPFYGKKHTEESRKKMSEKRKGRKLSTEWKENVVKGIQKKVINLDTGEVFESIKSAAEYYGLQATHITRVCKGKRKTTGGFRWEYYN